MSTKKNKKKQQEMRGVMSTSHNIHPTGHTKPRKSALQQTPTPTPDSRHRKGGIESVDNLYGGIRRSL